METTRVNSQPDSSGADLMFSTQAALQDAVSDFRAGLESPEKTFTAAHMAPDERLEALAPVLREPTPSPGKENEARSVLASAWRYGDTIDTQALFFNSPATAGRTTSISTRGSTGKPRKKSASFAADMNEQQIDKQDDEQQASTNELRKSQGPLSPGTGNLPDPAMSASQTSQQVGGSYPSFSQRSNGLDAVDISELLTF